MRSASRLLIVASLMLGCTTMRQLDLTQSIELEPDEGILVLHTVTDLPIKSIDLDGTRFVGDIPPGTRFWLFAIKEGKHRFSRILILNRNDDDKVRSSWRWSLKDEPQWAFTVTAGKVNYPGQIVMYTDGENHRQRHSFQLSNRSALAWTHIQSQAPDLLDQYPFEYVGYVRDDFMQEFLAVEETE